MNIGQNNVDSGCSKLLPRPFRFAWLHTVWFLFGEPPAGLKNWKQAAGSLIPQPNRTRGSAEKLNTFSALCCFSGEEFYETSPYEPIQFSEEYRHASIISGRAPHRAVRIQTLAARGLMETERAALPGAQPAPPSVRAWMKACLCNYSCAPLKRSFHGNLFWFLCATTHFSLFKGQRDNLSSVFIIHHAAAPSRRQQKYLLESAYVGVNKGALHSS